MSTVIKVENVSKQYRLGLIGTNTLKGDLQSWWYRVRGLPDPTLMIGQENSLNIKAKVKAKGLSTSASTSTSEDFIWALKDINFEVNQGEVLGIIGKNGAGKSTLLKLLSRVTAPTTGSIKVKGRIASLLEVGTGFHPELTGKENIFLNGAILGMTKTEIRDKFDEIVDFAGVSRYIDTPVKRYSSGMYVRLAFAVAAHLEPEILIVDEVLAVGDAEFQKKAIGKMQDVSRNDGRTVLFVSHNMLAVKSLCNKGILLENGFVDKTGEIENVVDSYLERNNKTVSSFVVVQKESNGFVIDGLKLTNNGVNGNFNIEKDLIFDIKAACLRDFDLINVNIFFNTLEGSTIFATCSQPEKCTKGSYLYRCLIPANTLNDIVYNIDLMVVENGQKHLLYLKQIISIEGVEGKRSGGWLGKFPGLIRPQYFKWSKINASE
jgi:lipopolysaccharide transport system ATP-binding protein